MTAREKAEWLGDPLDAELIGYRFPVNIIPTNCAPVMGRVIYDYLNIRSGPGSSYTQLGQLSRGDTFAVLEQSGRWGRIDRGWVNLGPDFVVLTTTGAMLKFRNESVTATALNTNGNQYAVIIIGDAARFVDTTLTLSVDEISASNAAGAEIALYWHDDTGSESAGVSVNTSGSGTFKLRQNIGGRRYLAMYLYAKSTNLGDAVRYSRLMLEVGDVRHDYVPYTPILPTRATRGAYNYADLNRVEMAVSEISDLLDLGLETKTDWNRWDVPTSNDLERYLENVVKIRDASRIGVRVPALPLRASDLDYTAANNIEMILGAAHDAVKTMPRSGELYCGEV